MAGFCICSHLFASGMATTLHSYLVLYKVVFCPLPLGICPSTPSEEQSTLLSPHCKDDKTEAHRGCVICPELLLVSGRAKSQRSFLQPQVSAFPPHCVTHITRPFWGRRQLPKYSLWGDTVVGWTVASPQRAIPLFNSQNP